MKVTIADVKDCLEKLSHNYPTWGVFGSRERNNAVADTWYGFFKNYDVGDFRNAVDRHMSESQYPPKISELKERIRDRG